MLLTFTRGVAAPGVWLHQGCGCRAGVKRKGKEGEVQLWLACIFHIFNQ